MLSKLSKNMALFFSKRGVVDERFVEIYELGYKELMCEIMINSILILVSYMCGLFVEGIIFMSVFSLFENLDNDEFFDDSLVEYKFEAEILHKDGSITTETISVFEEVEAE